MRIIAGAWRGRVLQAPAGAATRPTADRVRQALFDMLLHAPWGGRDLLAGAHVLDVFAGTGALGLEALSRGAAFATLIEQDRAALAALRANITRLDAGGRCAVLATSALATPTRTASDGAPATLVFLDPPYGGELVPRALHHLAAQGWITAGALVVAETARGEPPPHTEPLAERMHGATRVSFWRDGPSRGL